LKTPSINLTSEAISNFNEALNKEWILTNQLGGYSASTILGMNTRKYHGLLVAALDPPGGRTVCLAKLDEEVFAENRFYALGSNEFHGNIFPQGYRFLNEIVIAPFPSYRYNLMEIKVRKTIFMLKGKNATVVTYNVLNQGDADAKIRIFPLLTCRHFHSVIDRKQIPFDFSQQIKDRQVELFFNNPKATVVVRSTTEKFTNRATWIDRLYYREETSRGESNTDDWYQPGYFEVHIPNKCEENFAIVTAASTNRQECNDTLDAIGCTIHDVNRHLESETAQHEKMLDQFYNSNNQVPTSDWLSWILLAADSFITKGKVNKTSVVAGYFWFETWGRDTFISLPGLILATGRFEKAKDILFNFMQHSKQGLIPNFINDKTGEPSYNTADATLWFVNAVLQYSKYTGDLKFVQQQIWDGLKAIIENHLKGTAFNISVDKDGLLAHGPQLTWMDAEVEGKVITPRAGKAVEIQALWYNALETMKLLAKRFDEINLSEKYAGIAEKAKESFNDKFWNYERGYLLDVVEASGVDASLRPNQVIAVALDFTMLNNSKSKSVVDVIQRELLTPYGLRTLARSDSRYRGIYVGDRFNRDHAYHNGTVWPWLLGPFTEAFLKTKEQGTIVECPLKAYLLPLFTQQIFKAGLGTISEIFDGDQPHEPRGCVAQAWSVAEPLRAYLEDVMQIRPKYEKDFLQI
jgi:predicted glycogen debranching enzyme